MSSAASRPGYSCILVPRHGFVSTNSLQAWSCNEKSLQAGRPLCSASLGQAETSHLQHGRNMQALASEAGQAAADCSSHHLKNHNKSLGF